MNYEDYMISLLEENQENENRRGFLREYKDDEKKVDIFEIYDDATDTLLDLMNVLTYKDGALDRVDTFIGRHDRSEYLLVNTHKDLSKPNVSFHYPSFLDIGCDSSFIDIYKEKIRKLFVMFPGGIV